MIDRDEDPTGSLILALAGTLIIVLGVAACAPTAGKTWVHPERADQPSQEFRSDKRACLAEANDAAGDYSDAGGLVGKFYRDCMREKGWSLAEDTTDAAEPDEVVQATPIRV